MSARDERTASLRMMLLGGDPADRRTSLADARTAVCLARGVDPADIDPSSGHDLSRRAYDTVRASWIAHLRTKGGDVNEYTRRSYEEARAYWAARRPEFVRGDDWLAEAKAGDPS